MNEALHRIQCGTCGVHFAIPKEMHDTKKREGGYWFCPNGHERGYRKGTEQTELEKERLARQRADQRLAQMDDERKAALRREAAAKAQTTKLKNRVAKGVCPECNRTFQNLARHMETKHSVRCTNHDN